MNFKSKLQKKSWVYFFKFFFLILLLLVATEVGFRLNQSFNSSDDYLPVRAEKGQVSVIVIGDSVSLGFAKILKESIGPKFIVTILSKASWHINNYPASEMSKHLSVYKPDTAIFMLGPHVILENNNTKFNGETRFKFLQKFFIGKLLLKNFYPVFDFLSPVKPGPKRKLKDVRAFNLENDNLDSLLSRINDIPGHNHSFNKDQILKIIAYENYAEESKNPDRLKVKFLVHLFFRNFNKAESLLTELSGMRQERPGLPLYKAYLEESRGNFEKAKTHYLELKKSLPEQACLLLSQELFMRLNPDFSMMELKSCLTRMNSAFAPKFYSKLSLLEGKKGNFGEAERYSSLAVSSGEKNHSSLLWEAYVTRLNPNSMFLLNKMFGSSYAKSSANMQFLEEVKTHSIYDKKIEAFMNLYKLRSADSAAKKKELNRYLNPRIRFAMAMNLGENDEAYDAFMEIGTARPDKIKNYEIEEYRAFFSLAKKNKVHLLIMQKPNLRLESLRVPLGEAENITYFDTYSFFRNLTERKKIKISDLFLDDGDHLTDLGSHYLASEMIGLMNKAYK